MSDQRAEVLVVAEDRGLRDLISATLGAMGLRFDQADSRVGGAAKLTRRTYGLLLIGVDENRSIGFGFCQHMRGIYPDLGIILIGAETTDTDEIRALEAGADDYVSIPFRFREIVGRLRAVMLRPARDTAPNGTMLRAGDLRIDATRRLCWSGRKQIHLSPREFDLLVTLMRHKGRALTHVKLRIAVWGPEAKHDVDHLRSYVKALRKKIEINPGRPEYIRTVPWVGYMLCEPDKRPADNRD